MHSDGPLVVLRGLEKRYGRRRALAGIDLELWRGEIVGVAGPDGAGKTTLLRSLAGLLEVEALEARVLGFDLRADPTELKEHIGYVPQAFSLHRELSVIENLRFTARLHRLSEDSFKRAEVLLERTLLAPFRDRPAGALSGGMKQKLAVVNALLPEPDLVLLDEPTAGIDVIARREIWALLEEARERALVVVSTSYVEEADACQRLVYLDDGRVLASGPPAELRAASPVELYRVWGGDARTLAREARQLRYTAEARAAGRLVRVEVRRDRSPGRDTVLEDLRGLPGAALVEERVPDMESVLRALARSADGAAEAAA